MRFLVLSTALLTVVFFFAAPNSVTGAVDTDPVLQPFGLTRAELPATYYLVRGTDELEIPAGITIHARLDNQYVVSGPVELVESLARQQVQLAVQEAGQGWRDPVAPPPVNAGDKNGRIADPAVQDLVDQVTWSGMMERIQWLVDFQTRYSYATECDIAADGIATRLDDLGLEVEFHYFTHNDHPMRNVVATQMGTVHPDSVFVVCAHYDATSENPYVLAPGADDNASGTAGVLLAASLFADRQFEYTIKYVLFAGEEQGLRGSRKWAIAARDNDMPIVGALNFDMIGWWTPGVPFDLEIETNVASQWLAEIVTDAADTYTDMPYILHVDDGAWWGDHYSFWQQGYAALNHEESWDWGDPDFNEHYHSTTDLPQFLSEDFTVGCTRILIAGLATLARPISASAVDTAEMLHRGPALAVHPNPANPQTVFSFELDAPGPVNIEVFDLTGRKVAQVAGRRFSAGEHAVTWTGRDLAGRAAASGQYLVRLVTPAGSSTRKVALVR